MDTDLMRQSPWPPEDYHIDVAKKHNLLIAPCAFCGGTSNRLETEENYFQIHCNDCLAAGALHCVEDWENESHEAISGIIKAVDKWNSRPVEKATTHQMQALSMFYQSEITVLIARIKKLEGVAVNSGVFPQELYDDALKDAEALRHPLKRIRPSDIPVIVRRYQNGERTSVLSRDYKISNGTIINHLRAAGIKIRPRNEEQKKAWQENRSG